MQNWTSTVWETYVYNLPNNYIYTTKYIFLEKKKTEGDESN